MIRVMERVGVGNPEGAANLATGGIGMAAFTRSVRGLGLRDDPTLQFGVLVLCVRGQAFPP